MSTMKGQVIAEGHTAVVKEFPIPTPGEGEILVRVHYAAQNPTDWKGVAGISPAGRHTGCDFAGTIADANGSKWQEGQRVAGFVHGAAIASPSRGAFAEYTVIESSLVYPIPDNFSFQEAAVVPLAFATVVQALFQRLGLPEPTEPAKSSIPVLVYGGATSVGLYAIQLLKLAGLFIITTASKKNHSLLKELGADVVVDYHDADWVDQVRKLSHNNLQHVFDTISEVHTTKAAVDTLSPKKGGRIVCILPLVAKDVGVESNPKIKIENTIVYTVFERPFEYMGFENCGYPTPQDKAIWEKYLKLLPEYLQSGKIKPNPARELGGFDTILTGFKLHEEGKVNAEKLVYKIA